MLGMRILPILALLLSPPQPLSAQTAPPSTDPRAADVAAPPADATKTASGLATKVLTPGTGKDHPGEGRSRDRPLHGVDDRRQDVRQLGRARQAGHASRVNRVIPGFSEGLQLMVPGEKRRLWIPEALAYKGATRTEGHAGVRRRADRRCPTRAPADVKAPPADAKKTASGLAYTSAAAGHRRPPSAGRPSQVTVHYTGWTTDGKMFDSSVVRGQPATFALDGVIPGWTEGVQLMVEGEKTRFWIPEKLAYKGKSAPYGMLVFDVELIKIDRS